MRVYHESKITCEEDRISMGANKSKESFLPDNTLSRMGQSFDQRKQRRKYRQKSRGELIISQVESLGRYYTYN